MRKISSAERLPFERSSAAWSHPGAAQPNEIPVSRFSLASSRWDKSSNAIYPANILRGIRRDEIGIVGFEPLEFVQQAVELFVGNLRSVEDVVTLLVMANQPAQLADALCGIGFSHRFRARYRFAGLKGARHNPCRGPFQCLHQYGAALSGPPGGTLEHIVRLTAEQDEPHQSD